MLRRLISFAILLQVAAKSKKSDATLSEGRDRQLTLLEATRSKCCACASRDANDVAVCKEDAGDRSWISQMMGFGFSSEKLSCADTCSELGLTDVATESVERRHRRQDVSCDDTDGPVHDLPYCSAYVSARYIFFNTAREHHQQYVWSTSN